MEEQTENPNESILKPKAKRTLTDEQRLVLANRMRAINDKRIADAMAKKDKASPPVPAAPVETPKPEKKKRIIKVVEISEPETDVESESEEEIVIVPKKKVVKAAQPKPEVKPVARRQKKPQPVYDETDEEEEAPQRIAKPKPKKQEPVSEPPKILYRFL